MIEKMIEIPENNNFAYIIHKNFNCKPANGVFTTIFTSKKLLIHSKNTDHLSGDATYKVNWHNCPLIIL